MKFTKLQIQIAVLFGTLSLFLITLEPFRNAGLEFFSSVLGVLLALEVFGFVALEISDGSKKHGWKHEIIDTVLALVVAVVFWFAISFLLNTDTPISGVVSCSMLPNLQRGDFVIVQGSDVNAYTINMTKQEFESILDPTQIIHKNQSIMINGSLFSYCVFNRNSQLCNDFVLAPELFIESKGPFIFSYSKCPIKMDGKNAYQPCLESVQFKGHNFLTNFSNDVIIYKPKQGDLYSFVGDIVHRVFFEINVDGKKYYITRGDNNPILDTQVFDHKSGIGNSPVASENVKGKVIFRIPYLGYFKLFISGFFNEDSQCSTQLEYKHV